MLANKLMSTLSGGAEDKLYVDDVFSTYLYTGSGSPQTINNGINLSGKGGMVWHKTRGLATNHIITDTVRGSGYQICPNNTGANNFNSTYALSFKTNGFTENYGYGTTPLVSWTFRRAPKFFDVVIWTGNGASSRAIAHSLGQEVGMVMTKATSTSGDWNAYHRSATGDLVLNTTATQTGSKALVNSATTSTFTVSGAANTNAVTYIAYLFAHDPSADGIIQCGSYTGNGSATGPIVNLGWEPQYLMIKRASGTGSWLIIDSMRGMPVGSTDATLQANLSNAESSVDYISPTATGFQITSTSGEVNTSGSTYIYLAIRRPNKPPTTGTEVYNAIARTGTGAAATVTGVGFAPDLVIGMNRSSTGAPNFTDRLRGATYELLSSGLAAEAAFTNDLSAFTMDGFTLGTGASGHKNTSAATYIEYCLKRAPGVFDIVCYTGIGTFQNVNHSLGVVPELVIVKSRTGSAYWAVSNSKSKPFGNLDSTSAFVEVQSTAVTLNGFISLAGTNTTIFQVVDGADTATAVNAVGSKYAAYLFATKAGISKVGSYTGNGSSQTINCGFTTGVRFFLVKATSTTGSWWVFDSVRGVIAATDPVLQLNSTAAEITSADAVDPDASGIIVNQEATCSINANGVSYVYLAIA